MPLTMTTLPFTLTLTLLLPLATSSNTLNTSTILTTTTTLTSPSLQFQLGFIQITPKPQFYLSIYYNNHPTKTPVWVANPDTPVSDSATLRVKDGGRMVITEKGEREVWWVGGNWTGDGDVVVELLDNGNLVVARNVFEKMPESERVVLWQSFDHPGDTLLPGQKLGWDMKSGLDRFLSSWRGGDDPGDGDFMFRVEPMGDPEVFMWSKGEKVLYRSGPWVGTRWSGVPEMNSSSSVVFNFTFVDNVNEVYYMYEVIDSTVKTRLVLDSSGVLRRYTWIPDLLKWNVCWYAPDDQCDDYNVCGPFGVCNASSLALCQCVQGFAPKNEQAWALRDGSDGCVRETGLDCQGDGFLLMMNMKLPQSSGAFVNRSMRIEECEGLCRMNCSCTAYADAEFVAGVGSGCVMWFGSLIDLRDFAQGGQNLYVRLAASDLGGNADTSTQRSFNNTKNIILGVSSVLGFCFLLGFVVCFLWRKKLLTSANKGMFGTTTNRGRLPLRVTRLGATERSQDFLLSMTGLSSRRDYSSERQTDDLELPLFDLKTIVMATDNFSDEKKLGAGGFGCVYKGVLADGQEVAVKRLSKDSGQGSEQFRNEVQLIAKLQHRNLVRLLGCCIDMEEKMLLYEYLPNRSLDSIIFSKEKRILLDWRRRFNIICGIARGILYLHRDSLFRIIHRDLKASNVLLDAEWNPKISDFGMARLFGGEESESSNTRRVVGTYGYMSPEYAMDGMFSVKSDVFSFGVLVLEIVTGRKNRGFHNEDNEANLLGHAWKLWREGRGSELLDPTVRSSSSHEEVIRCVQVALLCVQERADDRPTMATVQLMLNSDSILLPRPKLPGFCFGWKTLETDSSSSKQDESFSVNEVTITTLDAR